MSVSMVSSFLPPSLIDGLEDKGEVKQGENPMCATALFIVNTILGAIKVLKACNYKSLDANPGDGGCQNRALELRRLVMLDLKGECAELEKVALGIKKLVNDRKGNPKERAKCSSTTFFQNHLRPLMISKEMEYILHCYLSAALKTPYEVQVNGIVMTRSDVSKLSKLSAKIAVLGRSCKKILEENQKTLSKLSVEAMHFSATQSYSLPIEEKNLMVKMLSPENTHTYTTDIAKYEPKTFGCLFYEVKVLLVRLREEQGIVCLKSISTTGDTFHLLLQSQGPSKEFEVIPNQVYDSLPSMMQIVVFEAVVNVDKKVAANLLIEYGFTNTILAQAAKEEPYEPGSKLKDIKVHEAMQEINAYKEKRLKMQNFMILDHVYLNTLGEEKIKNIFL